MTDVDDQKSPDSTIETVVDAARGRRTVHYGDDRTPHLIERADGSVLTIERDDRRRSLHVSDADGELFSLRSDGERVVATDRTGTTVASRTERSSRVARCTGSGPHDGASVLRVDCDDLGRPARVLLPGSTSELHYRPVGAGRWRVETSAGETVVELASVGSSRSVKLADGWGWSERVVAGAVQVTTTDGRVGPTTNLDRGGRVIGRIDVEGVRHSYRRDDCGRVVGWSGPNEVEWQFATSGLDADVGVGISGVVTDGRRQRWRTDEGSRVTAIIGGDATVRFDYDANGYRIARRTPNSATQYRYDAMGQLCSMVHPDGRRTEMGWDSLGRRIWVAHDGERLDEHRDLDGRLWAVTDSAGRAVHTFVWWEGRVIARFDGSVDSAVAEAYVTDPLGTLLAVATPAPDGWQLTDTIGNPYGEITGAYRPTLFGHISDRGSGLICFGSRLLDPSTASFITPDPWHIGADDPRLLAGANPSDIARRQEPSVPGVHPYALSQFDPLARPDLDGHFAWGNFFLTLILAPTWGFPLTSLSLFFFLPVDIYFELIGLIAFIFTDHPWPQHSFVNMKGAAASSQLGTAAFALNGFLPRATAGGVGGDRAVTIGHVVWENRRFFELLDRPRVLMVQDVAGPPDANGVPSNGPTAFSRTDKGSIVVVESTDTDNRRWIHGSWWTRGGGSHVGDRGGNQVFEDRVDPGTAHSVGSLTLAQPMPEAMATPRSPTATGDGELRVTEYDTHLQSDGEIVRDQWFAIAVDDDTGLAVGDAVRVVADDDGVEPAYAAVTRVLVGGDPILVLDHPLPARFHVDELKEDLELSKLSPASGSGVGTSAGWTAPPVTVNSPLNMSLGTPTPPTHVVKTGDVLAITPSPVIAAPERPVIYGEIDKVILTLDFTVAPPASIAGSDAFVLSPDGTVARGSMPDPPADPDTIAITGDHDFEVDDLLAIQPPTGSAHHARIINATAATDANPATVIIDPPVPAGVISGAGTVVRLARLRAGDRERDKGLVAGVSLPRLVVSTRRSDMFPAGVGVLFEQGVDLVVRTVATVTQTTMVLVDEMVPATPTPALGPDFSIVVQSASDVDHDGAIAANRFVRHTGGGAAPSLYGDWPDEIMGLVPTTYFDVREPLGWRFFVKSPPPAIGLHPDFRDQWEPLSLGSDEYWLLSAPLKFDTDGDGIVRWEPDPDDTYPRRHRQTLMTGSPATANWTVTIRGFARDATPVVRPLPGETAVWCRPAETQVPDEPRVRWSLADALDEHELAHTVQNTYWGPLLGALPLQGLFRTAADTFAAAGSDRPDWMMWNPFDEASDAVGFDDTNMFELLSMAGLMQLVWTFIILGPALADDEARHDLLGLNFSDWGQVFNPVNQQIINRVPDVDPNADAADRWGLYFANLAKRAIDMRSWTPLIGMVPLLLPDAATNPLEQQASRWTGDLYSTILSVNDRSNRTLRLRFGSALLSENREANQTIALGRTARVMAFYNHLERYQLLDRCDAPAKLTHLDESFERPLVRIELNAAPAGGPALLLKDHVVDVAAIALTPRQIDGPQIDDPSNPGTMIRVLIDCVEVPVNTPGSPLVLNPTLRSMVPAAPAVTRAMGFYFVPASEGTYTFTAYDGDAGAGDEDPFTYAATITIRGEIKVDEQVVEWVMPLARGTAGPPPALPSGDISRVFTQTVRLAVSDQDTSEWIAEADGAVTIARVAGGQGWRLTFGDPGTGFPARDRVRIWRPVDPNDAELFDFQHRDEPTRTGTRSYLDEQTWIPVRDFSVETTELPQLPSVTVAAAAGHVRNLGLDVAGAASIVVTPTGGRTLVHEPAGEDDESRLWRFDLEGVKALESSLVFRVRVRFGIGAVTADRELELTFEPNFTIDTATAGGPYVVSEAGGPLTLEITAGSAPFSISGDLPTGLSASVSGSAVTLSADDSASPGTHLLVVEDDDGRLGIRSIRIEL